MKWFVYDIWYLTPTACGAIAKPDEDFCYCTNSIGTTCLPICVSLDLVMIEVEYMMDRGQFQDKH